MLRSIPTTNLRAIAPSSFSSTFLPLSSRLLSTTTTTTTTSTSTSSVPPPPPAAATPAQPYRETRQPQRGPYYISRSASNNLPVYRLRKRGGNQLLTIIRKVEGDSRTLSQDLVAELALPQAEVKVNSRTNQVVIKGFHDDKVKEWLAKRGF